MQGLWLRWDFGLFFQISNLDVMVWVSHLDFTWCPCVSFPGWSAHQYTCYTHQEIQANLQSVFKTWTLLSVSRAWTHSSPPACPPAFVALDLQIFQIGLTPLLHLI